jgi:transposase
LRKELDYPNAYLLKGVWVVTDNQVRRLFRVLKTEKTLAAAAAKSNMDEKTARRYRKLNMLPSECALPHSWRTRTDPFEDVWDRVRSMLSLNPGLQGKVIFAYMQREDPGTFADGQLRTLQRRIKIWRATEGPSQEVFFPQNHYPGDISESDFTSMNKLGITIQGRQFDHLCYHFVLTYSNWETVTVCFSESFESLSEGMQSALWELGGVPNTHLTDCLTTAVNKSGNPEKFTARYAALLRHYGLNGRRTNPASPNENGDVEQCNNRFKEALGQSLMLRGSRDFDSREEYACFLRELVDQLNSGRRKRFAEDLAKLGRLPMKRLEACKRLDGVTVRSSSTIYVSHNIYSVNSRLINCHVNIRLYVDHLEVWYGQKKVEHLPRQRGENNHAIDYRHVIDWLVRKPGAFENYKWREDMFPTIRFRMAYDSLKRSHSLPVASREYLKILKLAADMSESGVDNALRVMIDRGEKIGFEMVEKIYDSETIFPLLVNVTIPEVRLEEYDSLLVNAMVAAL